jgi:DNA (cytosine-5)-methyltransferase 1
LKLICVDLFCGAGGTSEGLVGAAEELGLEVELIAINHWDLAIATHSANHPRARHICARIEEVRPREVVPGGRVHLLVASPECTHFSIAAGGRPIEDQRRIPAFNIITWLQELYVDNLILENVPEFRNWAPLGASGKPLKSRKGEIYRSFIAAIRACGYNKVEERELCCANYGDATTRKRLFIVGTRVGGVTWPEPTHSRAGEPTLFGKKAQWREARDIIDPVLIGKSIFDRPKPLAKNTLFRIAQGMVRFNDIDIAPYLGLPSLVRKGDKTMRPEPPNAYMVNTKGKSSVSSLDRPTPTLTTQPHLGVVQPLLWSTDGASSTASFTEEVNPFLIAIDHQGGNGSCINTLNEPLTTVTTKPRHGLVNAFIIGAGGPARAGEPRSLEKPLNTVLTRQSLALVEPQVVAGESFLVAAGGPTGKGRRAKSLRQPLDTILTENHDGLVQPYIVSVNHGESTSDRCHRLDEPLPTVTTRNGHGLVQAYLTKYYGTATVQPLDQPLDTVTTHHRFGYVEPKLVHEDMLASNARLGSLIPLGNGLFLDIRFRMLKNHELAGAMSFPKDYVFKGNQSKVAKQIGNAVPTRTAKALCRERLLRYANREHPPSAA